MSGIIGFADAEFRIALRNRWIIILTVTMALFSLVLTLAGSGPTGTLGADQLSVTVASLTGLAVYLVPLMALLVSFDAAAGEVERGTLGLTLAYPVSRPAVLLGKIVAHVGILALALLVGYGVAAITAFWLDEDAAQGLAALVRLYWSSVLLGAGFVGLGYLASALSRRPATAAGLVIGLWLVAIVLYDLGLLAAIVADDGGAFTETVFPWLLIGNPADAFRLFNLAASEATAAASGVSGAAQSIAPMRALASVAVWPLIAFGLAAWRFRRIVP
ncbi:ABC transporter permease [Jhaorihella thermophila]|uniref:Cu-processing system permease protein n=1 Tax=Jhaorihella thermophila TaxID=488547 RepID=A0A1H5YEF8_9RHOB|nr:ABC transporter permease subunit [Jhaorihella thermophila]SEG22334.1 Cu-processing system permease protein [Jhaorihella thermophila]